MSAPQQNSAPSEAKATAMDLEALRGQWRKVGDDAAALRAESRQARQHAARVRGEANAILDAVVLLVTDVLRRQGFALLAPVAARFRMADGGSTGFEIAVRLEDPSRAG